MRCMLQLTLVLGLLMVVTACNFNLHNVSCFGFPLPGSVFKSTALIIECYVCFGMD